MTQLHREEMAHPTLLVSGYHQGIVPPPTRLTHPHPTPRPEYFGCYYRKRACVTKLMM